jgi:hypothetical protein
MVQLEDCGFVRVGRLAIHPHFDISFDCREAEWWVCCVYAFKVGKEVLRIGKSERCCLSVRIDRWNKDVRRAIEDKIERPGCTSLKEAAEWKKALEQADGEFWAKRITPPNKESLRAEEKRLIREFCPRLCHDLPKECRPN